MTQLEQRCAHGAMSQYLYERLATAPKGQIETLHMRALLHDTISKHPEHGELLQSLAKGHLHDKAFRRLLVNLRR